MYFLNVAIKVSRRDGEEPAAHVPVHPQRPTVAALASLIDVEYCLNVVVAGGQLREAVGGMTEYSRVYSGGLARLKVLYIDSEDRCSVGCDLQSRLWPVGARCNQYHSTSDRACGDCLVVGYLKPRFRSRNRT